MHYCKATVLAKGMVELAGGDTLSVNILNLNVLEAFTSESLDTDFSNFTDFHRFQMAAISSCTDRKKKAHEAAIKEHKGKFSKHIHRKKEHRKHLEFITIGTVSI